MSYRTGKCAGNSKEFFAPAQSSSLQGFCRDPLMHAFTYLTDSATSVPGTVLGAGDTKTGIPLRIGHTLIGETIK